jgi:hypothetical protein
MLKIPKYNVCMKPHEIIGSFKSMWLLYSPFLRDSPEVPGSIRRNSNSYVQRKGGGDEHIAEFFNLFNSRHTEQGAVIVKAYHQFFKERFYH